MEKRIHVFDNGVRVHDDHLLPSQRERYRAHNVHEAEEEDLFVGLVQDLPRGGVFVDIGSAIGYYLLLAKRLRPDLAVHGVEPLKRHRDQFLDNVALNGQLPEEFTIHEEAISSSDGVAAFLEEGYGSVLSRRRKRVWRRGVRDVPTITLDRLVARIGGSLDLCQMDVQGHELRVLKSCRRSMQAGSITTFLIGTHSPTLHRGCIDILSDHGYRILHDGYEARGQPDGILIASR